MIKKLVLISTGRIYDVGSAYEAVHSMADDNFQTDIIGEIREEDGGIVLVNERGQILSKLINCPVMIEYAEESQ